MNNKWDSIEEALRKGPDVPAELPQRLKSGAEMELRSGAASRGLPRGWVPLIAAAAVILVVVGIFMNLPDDATTPSADELARNDGGDASEVGEVAGTQLSGSRLIPTEFEEAS